MGGVAGGCALCGESQAARDEACKELAALLPSDEAPSLTQSADRVISAEEQKLFTRVRDKLEEHDEFLGTDSDSDAEDAGTGGKLQVDYGDDADLSQAESLEDPVIKEWELMNAWTQLRHFRLPERGVGERILKSVTKLYAAQPNVVKMARPESGQHLIVVGDLHGHLGDLMHILDEHGDPREGAGGNIYIFNGDFVDRGMWGPEVLLSVYCLKLRFPSAVHLNRGNHEDAKMNALQANGFRDVHCVRAWKSDAALMFRLCRRTFLCLPLVHVIGEEICVIHGGLPLDSSVTLEEINKINRKRDVPLQSCCCLGYPLSQQVTARKDLLSRQGKRVQAGTAGEILRKVMKSKIAEVSFEGTVIHANVCGAPELEQELTPVYPSDAEKELQRLDRIFVALLWSDPIETSQLEPPGPNTSRGTGAKFDSKMTETFLKANGLQCLLRSHQKRGDGYQIEQCCGGKPSVVTVFSASNYLEGDEEGGNLASVAMFSMDKASVSQPLVSSMRPSEAWSEPVDNKPDHFALPEMTRKASLAALRRQTIDTEDKDSRRKTAHKQALEQLWLMIYCYRPELLAFFSKKDKNDTGMVSKKQWVSAMRGCLIPDDTFPWEELAPYLTSFDKQGMCHYPAFLMRYRNALSSRLEGNWCSRALGRLYSKLGQRSEAEAHWTELDRNGDGSLSYFELRPLLKANLTFSDTEDIEDDAVFTLLSTMDKDCSGYVDKEEFLQAIRRGEEWIEKMLTSSRKSQKQDDLAIDQCWVFLHNAMRALSLQHTSASTLFKFFHSDIDEELTRKEFQAGLKALLPDDHNTGGNEGESSQPLLRAQSSHSLSENMRNWEPLLWALIDTDKSGSVSLDELRAALYVSDTLSGLVVDAPDTVQGA